MGLLTSQGEIFTPSHMRDNLLIHPYNYVRVVKAKYVGTLLNNPPMDLGKSEQKGYLLIRELWKRGTDSIHDMRAMKNYTIYH